MSLDKQIEEIERLISKGQFIEPAALAIAIRNLLYYLKAHMK